MILQNSLTFAAVSVVFVAVAAFVEPSVARFLAYQLLAWAKGVKWLRLKSKEAVKVFFANYRNDLREIKEKV